MLDSETKRKIDNCRDILVGKLPDPKSQIEQITIALIYKFMDDMDKQSEELGGKPKFFTGEFEKYSWSNLVSPKISGQELISYYNESLLKMNQNKNIPQLFRDIFKNAYLPYRDPETLKSFLKEIDWFNYDHSEKLGDAFEYLLSVMGSQGDAGQFRTPRHIIDFIVKIVDPDKNEGVLDHACGTAGFLISAYKHILDKNRDKNGKISLTLDEKKRLINNFVGYDISPDMVRLSLVNLYLHGFPDPKIFEYDTLTSEERWNEQFEVIMANPPFMTPKGGIKPHKRFSVQANRSEVLFVDYIAEHLTPQGRAGIVVPEGIIFQSGNAYQQLRKMLLENSLYSVISLPAGVFNPYSGVKTSILLLDKSLVKKTDKILFVKIENDGFGLGAQRREVSGSDLPIALEIITKYRNAIKNGKEKSFELTTLEQKKALIIKKSELSEDYNLSQDRYRKQEDYNGNWPLVELGELEKEGKIEFLRVQGLTKGDIIPAGKNKCIHYGEIYTLYDPIIKFVISKTNYDGKIKSLKGDCLVPATTTADALGISVARSLNEAGVILGGDINIIRTKNEHILSDYLAYLISSPPLKLELAKCAKGVNIMHLSNEDLRILKIPIPPLEIQKQIVAELEGYQNIIEGARKVVENYKPGFKIDPDWEMVELGDVAKIEKGSLITEKTAINGKVPVIAGGQKPSYYHNQSNRQGQTITVSASGAYAGFVNYFDTPIFASDCSTIKGNEKILNTKYTYYFLKSIQEKIYDFQQGGAQPHVYPKHLQIIKIPLPSIEVQKQIVAKIEEEQKLVDSNKQLIDLFEKKVKDKISEVWGEKDGEGAGDGK